jgi:hypothetical protein
LDGLRRVDMAMKAFLVFVYMLFLVVLAIFSAVISFVNDGVMIFCSEVVVDVAVISGVALYLLGKHGFWWLLILLPTTFGELFLLASDPNLSMGAFVFWVVVLTPGFVMNFLVVYPPKKDGNF